MAHPFLSASLVCAIYHEGFQGPSRAYTLRLANDAIKLLQRQVVSSGKDLRPRNGLGISRQEFRVGSRKGTWGLNEHSYSDPVDSLSLEDHEIQRPRQEASGTWV